MLPLGAALNKRCATSIFIESSRLFAFVFASHYEPVCVAVAAQRWTAQAEQTDSVIPEIDFLLCSKSAGYNVSGALFSKAL